MALKSLLKEQLVPIGDFPKVNMTLIPRSVSDDFSKTILACVRKFFQNDGVMAEYERWLSDERAKQKEGSKQNG